MKTVEEFLKTYNITVSDLTCTHIDTLNKIVDGTLKIDDIVGYDDIILNIIGLYCFYHLKINDLAEKYYILASKYPSAIYNLAYLYDTQNKLDLAEKNYLDAIDKKIIIALHKLGELYQRQHKLDLAEKYLLLALHQNVLEANTSLTIVYILQNKIDLAEKYSVYAIEHNQSRELNNIGVEYYIQHNIDQAKKYFVLALAINQTYSNALYNLANVYEQQHKLDLAEEYYLKAIDNKHIIALNNIGFLYNKQNKFNLAEKYYLLAIEQGHVIALNNLCNKLMNHRLKLYHLLTNNSNLNIPIVVTKIKELGLENDREILIFKNKKNMMAKYDECMICTDDTKLIPRECSHYYCCNCYIKLDKCAICML